MNFFKKIIQEFGTLIASETDPPNINYNNGVVIGGGGGGADVRVPLSSSSSDEENEPERYQSDSEANEAFVRSYWSYMLNFWGRDPFYRTDLYAGMLPVDIVVPSGESYRFWWLPTTHPFASVLRNGSFERQSSEGVFDSQYYGAFIVYEDAVIEYCLDSYMEVCQDYGLRLEMVESLYAKTVKKEEEEFEKAHALIDLQAISSPSPPPTQQHFVYESETKNPSYMNNVVLTTPPIIPTAATIINRSEGSKKSD